jgi:hypothetical protein
MAKSISQLDGNQTLQHGFDDAAQAHRVTQLNSLVPEEYDYIALTYVGAGPGMGEISTVTYKVGGASGTTVATLTLGYDGSNRLTSILRS